MSATLKRNVIKQGVPRHNNPKKGVRLYCYLCGKSLVGVENEKEREHVIPRILFTPHNLQDPLILSACNKCNKDKGHDEEYVARYMQVSSAHSSPIAETGFVRAFNKAKSLQPRILVMNRTQATKGTGIIGQMAKITQGVDMYSEGGIYLGEYGQAPIDGHRFSNFYIRMAKGFFTAATGEIFDWDNWKIAKRWDTYTYGKYLKPEQFLFAYSHGQYDEDWGSSFGYAGFVHTRDDGSKVSMWSFGIFNEQMAIVTFAPEEPAPTTGKEGKHLKSPIS